MRTSSRKRETRRTAKFERLWNGNTVGYDSQSEADMALCCLLAFWTGGDRTQMKQLFRQSGLLREKWDEVHYADGSTYGEKTIERAIATTSEFYDPDAGDDTADDTPGGSSPDVGAADSERSRAYLAEKNRLLSERVDELEATLTEKPSASTLSKREIERLTDELATRGREEESQGEHVSTANENGAESESSLYVESIIRRSVRVATRPQRHVCRPRQVAGASRAPINDGFGTYDPDADGTASSNQLRRGGSVGGPRGGDPERPESRVARRARGVCPRRTDSRTGGGRRRRPAGVGDETYAVRRRRRRRRAVSEAALRQPAWLARDYRSSRPFATSSSPKSLGRQSHRRSAHEKQQPASQTRSP